MVLAAGGTGGHFYPGYVLAKALKEQGAEPLFLIREDDPAARVLAADELPYVEVPLKGLPRKPSLALLAFPFKLARSLALVDRVLSDYRPRVVVGMGGYLTFPAALAAWRAGAKVLLHESNAVLGLANRASLPFAGRLALGLPFRRPPRVPFLLSGTPVRQALWKLPDAATARRKLGLDPDSPTLLVFGGSQGARTLNQTLPQALRLAASRSKAAFQVLHLPGAKEADAVKKAYEGAPFKASVLEFLNEMELGYAAADLVVCRSGASTLAELAATRRAALLLPYPFAAADHQRVNAWTAARAGAARCLLEQGATAASLADALGDLIPSGEAGSLGAKARLLEMGRCWSKLELPSPADCVAGLVQAVRELAEIQ